jgi:hypothetical protein
VIIRTYRSPPLVRRSGRGVQRAAGCGGSGAGASSRASVRPVSPRSHRERGNDTRADQCEANSWLCDSACIPVVRAATLASALVRVIVERIHRPAAHECCRRSLSPRICVIRSVTRPAVTTATLDQPGQRLPPSPYPLGVHRRAVVMALQGQLFVRLIGTSCAGARTTPGADLDRTAITEVGGLGSSDR